MKKKMITAVLGICLAAGLIGIRAAWVSADPEPETENEAVLDTDDAPEAAEEGSETEPEAAEDEQSEESDTDAGQTEEDSDGEETPETETEDRSDSSDDQEVSEEDSEDEISGMKISLENTLAEDVTSVEVSTFEGDAWSGNLLKEGSRIEAGESGAFGIPLEFQDPLLGMYNVRILLADGEMTEIPFVPFLEDASGVLVQEEGTVLIHVRDERLEAEEEQLSTEELQQREAEVGEVMADVLADETE